MADRKYEIMQQIISDSLEVDFSKWAVEKYGKPDYIKHCFTAGGTVLNALGSAPVPYLQALYLAAKR